MYELDIYVGDGGVGDGAEAEHLPQKDPEGPDVTLVIDHPRLEDLGSHPPDREPRADAGEVLY